MMETLTHTTQVKMQWECTITWGGWRNISWNKRKKSYTGPNNTNEFMQEPIHSKKIMSEDFWEILDNSLRPLNDLGKKGFAKKVKSDDVPEITDMPSTNLLNNRSTAAVMGLFSPNIKV